MPLTALPLFLNTQLLYSACKRSQQIGAQSPGIFKFQLSFSRLNICVKDQYFLFLKKPNINLFPTSLQALIMVCTVLNFSFMAFTTHNCSLNISLPVSGWGSVLMNTEIHLPGVMYDPILMFCLDENAWERQGTDFYICNNTGLKMWAMIFVQ